MYGIKMDRNISQSFDLFPVVVLRASTTILVLEPEEKFWNIAYVNQYNMKS